MLLAVLFVNADPGKLSDVGGFAGYLASGGVPAFLAWPVILLKILGGLAILVGLQIRATALALGAFCVLSGVVYHFVPADQMHMTQLFKYLGLAGGFLLLAQTGAGAWSVDARMGRGRA